MVVAAVLPEQGNSLISIHYFEDLGGANARNGQQTEILLDFGGVTPRAIGSVQCEYNDGGGVCTALDSRAVPRYAHSCSWISDLADARCEQTQDVRF